MNNQKHTPGPWNMEREKHGIFILHEGFCIATTADIKTSSDCREWQPAKANAQLIATAPELLEIVKQLTQVTPDPTSGNKVIVIGVDSELLTMAKQAIAKAEGK